MAFHLFEINEIYSNASGTVQFIELRGLSPGQNFFGGHTLTVTQGGTTHSFTFPSDLPAGSTAGASVLIATQGFADLGLVTPDYIVPSGFLFTAGTATINFGEGADTLLYSNIPTNGTQSLNGSGVVVTNSPTNFSGDTGSITANTAPVVDNPLADGVSGVGQLFTLVVPVATFDDADGDALSLSATLANGDPLPAWLSFNPGTRTFSGTPTAGDTGVLSVRVTANDGSGGSVSDSFSLQIISGVVLVGTAAADALVGAGFADSLSGADGNDTLGGAAGADTLAGGNGSDSLDGGAGVDSLTGGAGGDTYVVSAGDILVEAADGGTDTVQSAGTWILGTNLEHLQLTGDGAVSGTGNGLANRITGNTAGNTLKGGDGADTLDGGGGNDTLMGGAGADLLRGGAGDDTYTAETIDTLSEAAGAGTDTVRTDASWVLAANFENLVLTGAAASSGTGNTLGNVLTGNSLANALDGAAGADTLNGGGGSDTLTGASGADVLAGGTGNDTYIVGFGDSATEAAGAGADVVQSDASWTLGANIETLVLLGTGNLNGTGNLGANTLGGTDGNNQLDGGGGSDTLNGGAGNDTLIGGTGADRLSGGTGDDRYVVGFGDVLTEAAGAGTDLVVSEATWTLGATFENLTLSGAAVINGTGNGLGNTLLGNAGANVLKGLEGRDSLAGGGGEDALYGGGGNDTLTGGAGADAFVFEETLSSLNNVNAITDFLGGTDRILLDDDIFTVFDAETVNTLTAEQFRSGAGISAAQDADDRIVYDTTSGSLYYDSDGAGGVAAVKFAVLGTVAHPALAATDFALIG